MDADVPKVMRLTKTDGLFEQTSPRYLGSSWRFSGFSGEVLLRDDAEFSFCGRCLVEDWASFRWEQTVNIAYSRLTDVLEMDWGYLVKGKIGRASSDDNLKLRYDYHEQVVALALLAQRPPFYLSGRLDIVAL